MTMDAARKGGWDRQLAMATLIAAAVLISRGILIAHDHGPTVDENYHLYRGLLFLRQDWPHIYDARWNDPPLGEALLAIPAWLNGVRMSNPIYASAWSRDVPPLAKYCYVMPDSIRIQTAIWKSILFLPAIAVIFEWVRRVYSAGSAWLAVAMLLIEPTLAAHLPLPTLDSLGTEGIVIAAWAAWRFVCQPTPARQWTAAAAMAIALLLKHVALLLPIAALLMAAVAWLGPGRALGERWAGAKKLLVAAGLVPMFIWILLLGEISVPRDFSDRPFFGKAGLGSHGIPAGLYVESVWEATVHARTGQENYLLGQYSRMGWWYYFPVVASYKIPIGIGAVMALGLASLIWIKPRYEEAPLAICAALWTGGALLQHVDVGFRHFLPALVFWLMLASRVGSSRRWIWPALAWLAMGWAALDTARWSPDFLSYVNFPRTFAYLDISDSNVDWGQATKELRQWIDRRSNDGRPIYLGYFGRADQNLFEEIGPRLTQYLMNGGSWISRTTCPEAANVSVPRHGILVVSPVSITAQFDRSDRFAKFRNIPPEQVVGHCLLVYDLDKLSGSCRPSGR
jgi:hypothetical protein